ncbi:MAG: efflux RND transporter permease subunit [Acidobacteriota bacterium]
MSAGGSHARARAIVLCALVGLAALAAPRLTLHLDSDDRRPALRIFLSLPSATDPGTVARRWIAPIEERVRSLGGVREVAGEVWPNGARLEVSLQSRSDPELKASRLQAELAALRALLPTGGRLRVVTTQAGQGDLVAVVWVAQRIDQATLESAIRTLRRVPGIRAVETWGARDEAIDVILPASLPGSELDSVALDEAITTSVSATSLGAWRQAGARADLWRPPTAATPEEVAAIPVSPGRGGPMLPLASLAAVERRVALADVSLRRNGASALALAVYRENAASVLGVDRRLRQAVTTLPPRLAAAISWREAEALGELLVRLTLGFALAVLTAGVLGTRAGGATAGVGMASAPVACLAATVLAFASLGDGLDFMMLLAVSIGVAAMLAASAAVILGGHSPLTVGLVWSLCASIPPCAALLTSSSVDFAIEAPSQAFWITVLASSVALPLLPRGPHRLDRPERRARAGFGMRRLARWTLRDPGSALLVAATAAVVLAALWGPALAPRAGVPKASESTLFVDLELATGSTRAATGRHLAATDEALRRVEGLGASWGAHGAGWGWLEVEIDPTWRRPDRLAEVLARLRRELPAGARSQTSTDLAHAVTGARRGPIEPEADDDGHRYRVVLRGLDLADLRATYDRAVDQMIRAGVRRHWIEGWQAPESRIRLAPRPLAAVADAPPPDAHSPGPLPPDATALAAELRRLTEPPTPVQLPGTQRRIVRVHHADTRREDEELPQLANLLARPLHFDGHQPIVAASLVGLHGDLIQPRVQREDGRFVAPITVHIPHTVEARRLTLRRKVDRALARLPKSTATDLERPALGRIVIPEQRLQLWALAALVSVLFFAVAAVLSNSLTWAALSLSPLVLAVFAAAPAIHTTAGRAHEMVLVALAAATAAALPVLLTTLPAATAYRPLLRAGRWIVAGLVPAIVLLAAPLVGAAPRAALVAPLLVAAIALATATLAGLVLVPASGTVLATWRRRGERAAARDRIRQVWAEGPPELQARALTKIYPGGRRALDRVDFTLKPSITGLVGPNGAGKSTLLRLLTGLLAPSRGQVLYRGRALRPELLQDYHQLVGYLPQDAGAYTGFTAEELLDWWAKQRGLGDHRQRAKEVARRLDEVRLTNVANRKVVDFSGGMRQRVGIARALLGSPSVLIIDEPTAGLDLQSRQALRDVLLDAAQRRIVLFSTHIASDLEATAERILVLSGGALAWNGPTDDLVARADGRVFEAMLEAHEMAAFAARHRITARSQTADGIAVRAVVGMAGDIEGEPVAPSLEEACLDAIERARAAHARADGA